MTKGMEFINPNLNLNPPQEVIDSPVLTAADKLKEKIDEVEQRAKKAEEESVTDSLTGCYNRNFFEKFKQENFDPQRDNNRLGLVFVDLNNLKTINDTQSHEAGDKLLQKTAQFLKNSFRKEDIVVRLGGDEFLIICRNYGDDPNFKENLSLKITKRLTEKPPVNFSFGIAVYNKDQDLLSLNQTKNRADSLMYKNKGKIKLIRQTTL